MPNFILKTSSQYVLFFNSILYKFLACFVIFYVFQNELEWYSLAIFDSLAILLMLLWTFYDTNLITYKIQHMENRLM